MLILPNLDEECQWNKRISRSCLRQRSLKLETQEIPSRGFFGSAINGIAHDIDSTTTSYQIDHEILREKQRNPVIKMDYTHRLSGLNFSVITKVPYPAVKNRGIRLKVNISRRHRWSNTEGSRIKQLWTRILLVSILTSLSELDIWSKPAVLCRSQRKSQDSVNEPTKLDVDDDINDDEQFLIDTHKHFRHFEIQKRPARKWSRFRRAGDRDLENYGREHYRKGFEALFFFSV